MIQQNKQQLTMAVNTRDQTQKFSNAETLLADAKNTLNTNAAHSDPTLTEIGNRAHQCVPTASFKQDIGLADSIVETVSVKVRILAASCMSAVGVITKCTSYNPTTATRTCYPLGVGENCTTKTPTQIADLFTNATDVCYQPYDPLCTNPNSGSNPSITTSLNPADNYNPNPRCRLSPPNPLPPPSCPKEIYTIQVISTENGTTREIISDHVIGCGT